MASLARDSTSSLWNWSRDGCREGTDAAVHNATLLGLSAPEPKSLDSDAVFR